MIGIVDWRVAQCEALGVRFRYDTWAEAGRYYHFFAQMTDDIRSNMADLFLLASEPFSLPQANPTIPADALDSEGNYLWAKSDLHNRVIKLAGKSATSKAFSVPPKEFMFISRKFIGAYTFMTVLDARTKAADLVASFLK